MSETTIIEKIRKSKTYKIIKQSLMDQLERMGNDTPHNIDLINDYMKMYIVKEVAYMDIQERGSTIEWQNSATQKGVKRNESVDIMLKTNQQMLKLLGELGIQAQTGADLDDEEL